MRLGIQSQRLDRAVLDFAIRANTASFKAIAPQPVELLREMKAALPACLFIYRPYFHTQPLDDPKRRAREAVEAALPMLAQFPWDYTELYNETGLWDQAYDYIAFTIEAARLLHIAGQKLLAYSFPWGNPAGFATFPYEQDPAAWMEGLRQHWAPYCDGLRAADGLALHQYKIPNCADKFSILRHRLVRDVLPADLKAIPIHLTEFGLDDKANPGESGWRGISWNWTAERYAEWLEGISIAIGDEVASAQIFVCATPTYTSFEILDQPVIADAIARVNQGGGTMPGEILDLTGSLPKHPSKTYATRPLSAIDAWVVHHTGANMDTPVSECARRTAVYHINEKGWAGIGYHGVIAKDGGAAWTLPLGSLGAHCGVHNSHTVGILLDGDWRYDSPPRSQIAALRQLLALHPEWRIYGHRELPGAATACPGGAWWEGFIGQPPVVDWQAEAERLRVENATLRAKQSHAEHLAAELYTWLRT